MTIFVVEMGSKFVRPYKEFISEVRTKFSGSIFPHFQGVHNLSEYFKPKAKSLLVMVSQCLLWLLRLGSFLKVAQVRLLQGETVMTSDCKLF